MTDTFATASAPVDNRAGVRAMSRLADRLVAVTPPPAAARLASSPLPQFSPAVTAALSRSAALAERADRRARRSRSIVGMTVDSFVSACSFIPYALVALVLRLVMARLYFLDGQAKVTGPRVPLNVQDFDLSVVLPLQLKTETFNAFLTQYAALPVPPMLAAYLVSYAEFILPICLVLGFGTRFAALGLLIMTVLIQIYVMPQALWTMHVYWASILMVLLALGAGQISVDYIIRFVSRR
jgi:putative oxidoreductase